MWCRFIYYLLLLAAIAACDVQLPEEVALEYRQLPEVLDFNRHVKPILSDKCFTCHGPDKAKVKANLRLDLSEVAYSELTENPGKRAITPGSLKKSEVFHRVVSTDPDYLMPQPESNLELSPREKAVLIKWIEDGAEYKPHWAFIKPVSISPPAVENESWVRNPIDNFVLHRLEAQALQPTAAGEKQLLLRRLSFDLTGLPPTTGEIEDFLQDSSLDAYEKQVDRLLASPHYGEKMAMDWMDLARFADTHGYTVDRYRDMSPWRDWVIKAFSQNMPYDEFILWQMAGDMLSEPSDEQILASAFLRIHPQNMEGGIVPEEFRVEYVVDRVSTVGEAFMALTLGCARCHDHKYDPISQKNFYQLSSFFNNVNESGQISFDDAMPVPTLMLPTPEQGRILDYIKTKIDSGEDRLSREAHRQGENFQSWLRTGGHKELAQPGFPRGLGARFNFDNRSLSNALKPSFDGRMARTGSNEEKPNFVPARSGVGLLLDGDAWLDLTPVGVFSRSQPFSVGLTVKIPRDLADGVIFHKGQGAILFNFRGYHLALKDNRFQVLMAHTAPDNAIVEHSISTVPREQWIDLLITYDGSSQAHGLKLYCDGVEIPTEVETDNLYKEILLTTDLTGQEHYQPGLQIGARDRGKGIGGAVVDEILVFNRELTPLEVAKLSRPSVLRELASRNPNQLSSQETAFLNAYYMANHSVPYLIQLAELQQVRSEYAEHMEAVREIMVMKELPDPRPAYVLERGQYDAHGEEVFPATPASILPMPKDLPLDRIGLAKWLVHPDHPLTSRVAVNRYWQNYFGRGLVKTTEDFGNQGDLPSHPDLLDWLAIEFRDSGWNVKALQKLIVMSSTYRQGSAAPPESFARDPDNTWLSRGPSLRLTGEMVRDNALAAAGILKPDIGGESVRPYQPEGLWEVNNTTYRQDTGDKLYRRSLYTIWKRSVPNPTLATFDAPERSQCTVRRQQTNTPLQALVLLNDPTYVEAAKALGQVMTQTDNPESAINEAFVKLTGREPLPRELEILKELQAREFQKFTSDLKRAEGWIGAGEFKLRPGVDPALVAANAVVASTIMNSDAAITKR